MSLSFPPIIDYSLERHPHTNQPHSFHKTQNKFWKPTINLDKLWTLVPQETRDEYTSGKKKDTAPVFDLLPLGYSKVLGKGRLPEIPIVVRARYVSKQAEEKIKAAGGKIELVA